MTKRAERNTLIDAAKGLSILLVVLGHSQVLPPDVNRAFSSFRMPFFFFLSGVFLSDRGAFKDVFLSKTDSLLKPYFVTLFVGICLTDNLAADLFLHRFADILYGVGDSIKWPWAPLWFLPHLWLLSLSAHFLVRHEFYRKDDRTGRNIIVLSLLLVIADLTTKASPDQANFNLGGYAERYGLPLRVEILPISLTFFLLGHSLRERVKLFKPSLAVVLLSITTFVAFHLYFDIYVDLNHSVYRFVPTAIVAGFCGIYFSLSLSYLIDRVAAVTGVFSYVGRSSLFILLFHGFILSWCRAEIGTQYWFAPVVSYFISIASCLLISALVFSSNFLSLFFCPLKNNDLFQAIDARMDFFFTGRPK